MKILDFAIAELKTLEAVMPSWLFKIVPPRYVPLGVLFWLWFGLVGLGLIWGIAACGLWILARGLFTLEPGIWLWAEFIGLVWLGVGLGMLGVWLEEQRRFWHWLGYVGLGFCIGVGGLFGSAFLWPIKLGGLGLMLGFVLTGIAATTPIILPIASWVWFGLCVKQIYHNQPTTLKIVLILHVAILAWPTLLWQNL